MMHRTREGIPALQGGEKIWDTCNQILLKHKLEIIKNFFVMALTRFYGIGVYPS